MSESTIAHEYGDLLWSILDSAGHDKGLISENEFCVATMLGIAVHQRRLPSDAEMEKLERKATIARTLFARYSRDWVAQLEYGKASPEVLVGTATLFLLDSISATSRARALKRLNAALWMMETSDWNDDAPAARTTAAIAERIAFMLTRG